MRILPSVCMKWSIDLFERLGLAHRQDAYPSELSGREGAVKEFLFGSAIICAVLTRGSCTCNYEGWSISR